MRISKHPIKKLRLITVFGTGYVLGAKAGRERYDQIMQAFGQVKADPRVQEAAARAQDLARDATAAATNVGSGTSDSGTGGQTSPLLADEHVQTADEIVYSTGPDIEETIDELNPDSGRDRV